jgi:hypothetical protein
MNQLQRFNRLTGAAWLALLLAVAACGSGTPTTPAGPAAGITPVAVQDLDVVSGQTIYVPAYAEVPIAGAGRALELMVTVVVHNTDLTHSIVLTSVRYYRADGELVQEYLAQPQRLGPLETADFVVEPERGRGVGANFIVEWVAEEPVYEPIVEALMVNTSGNQGVSFSSVGRVISQIE